MRGVPEVFFYFRKETSPGSASPAWKSLAPSPIITRVGSVDLKSPESIFPVNITTEKIYNPFFLPLHFLISVAFVSSWVNGIGIAASISEADVFDHI